MTIKAIFNNQQLIQFYLYPTMRNSFSRKVPLRFKYLLKSLQSVASSAEIKVLNYPDGKLVIPI